MNALTCTKSYSSLNAPMDAGWNNSVTEFEYYHSMWYYFACTRKGVHLYCHESSRNDICSFKAKNVAITLSFKLGFFFKHLYHIKVDALQASRISLRQSYYVYRIEGDLLLSSFALAFWMFSHSVEFYVLLSVLWVLGYWHQMADERHDNHLPRLPEATSGHRQSWKTPRCCLG